MSGPGLSVGNSIGQDVIDRLRDMQRDFADSSARAKPEKGAGDSKSFAEHLTGSIKEVDQMQKSADTMATDLATGKSGNIHETMIATSEAQLAFNLMVQIRNKALEAYQEVMRMPV